MSNTYTPTPIDGAQTCTDCGGSGILDENTDDERECEACDGLGEWFE